MIVRAHRRSFAAQPSRHAAPALGPLCVRFRESERSARSLSPSRSSRNSRIRSFSTWRPAEVQTARAARRIAGADNVPLNIDGVKQSERPTTQDEFLKKIKKAIDALPKDRPIITHCGSGGRGGKGRGRATIRIERRRFYAHRGGARVRETESGNSLPTRRRLLPTYDLPCARACEGRGRAVGHTDPAVRGRHYSCRQSQSCWQSTASPPSSPASCCFESAFFTSNSRKL